MAAKDIVDVSWSKTGGGNDRVTTTREDGSIREATRTETGVIVTDKSPDGTETTSAGATDAMGTLPSATPLP